MKSTGTTTPQPPKRSLPCWLGGLCCGLRIPLAHGVIPWAVSLLATRHGWVEQRPGIWNWLGLVPVLVGSAGIIWAMAMRFVAAPRGWEWELTPKYLLRRGPYAYSRNPIYVAELVIWIGWTLFYGSLLVIGFLVSLVPVGCVVLRREERSLEARFGDAYREYKRTVPRCLGKVRS